jgi:hypothetical protein
MKWQILLGITRYKPEAQTMIITTCMCLHNYICDNNLRDDHFDTFDSDGYVHVDSASHPSVAPVDEGTMDALCDAIAQSLVP